MARWSVPLETLSVFIAIVSLALAFVSADNKAPLIMIMAVGVAAVAAIAKLQSKK